MKNKIIIQALEYQINALKELNRMDKDAGFNQIVENRNKEIKQIEKVLNEIKKGGVK